ncbi:MAG: SDR family NAD(P)-dependent oxidoreductase [Acidimicrobiia bacterium]
MIDPLASFRLDGRVAVVTGASSGLGNRFARALAAAGADVVVAARRRERLDALVADLPGSPLAVRCDVTVDADLQALVDTAIDRYGRIDVLVNNAGIREGDDPIEHEPFDEFRATIETNLISAFRLSQLVAPTMIAAKRGAIVNITSVQGDVGSGSLAQPGYAASKGGLNNLTREMATNWARHGIRVNALAPGYFASELTAEMMANERALDWLKKKVPMRRIGEEGELDGALLFLASDASTYVTGSVLVVDGGYLAV